MTHSRYRTFRWVMAALGLAAGALLVATDHLVVGIVIGGLALTRLAFLCSWEHRRRRARRAGGEYPLLQTLARGQFEVAADAIGISAAELRVGFATGRSIAEVASAHGVAVESVVAAVVADASDKLDRAVANGLTTRLAADRFTSRLPEWATRLVNRHRSDLRSHAGALG